MVASCRLPFGNPNLKIFLLAIIRLRFGFRAGTGLSPFDVNPIAFEIRAAIHAHLGDFAGAQKDQARAVGMAKKLHWNTAPQEARVADYKANKAWTGDLFAFY